MIDIDILSRFAWALAAVLGLIAGAGWIARRYVAGGRIGRPGARRRLAVVEAAAIDGKSRLVLVRRDDVEHLLLLGQGGAVVVERAIAGPASFARQLDPALPRPEPVETVTS